MRKAVRILPNVQLRSASAETAELACTFTGDRHVEDFDSLVLVGARLPNDRLWDALNAAPRDSLAVQRIGDTLAPRLLTHAVFSGHMAAREFDLGPQPAPVGDASPEPDTQHRRLQFA